MIIIVAGVRLINAWAGLVCGRLTKKQAAVLLAVATGSVLGPVVAGSAAEAFGAAPMFLGTAALAAAAALAIRSGTIRESPHPE